MYIKHQKKTRISVFWSFLCCVIQACFQTASDVSYQNFYIKRVRIGLSKGGKQKERYIKIKDKKIEP